MTAPQNPRVTQADRDAAAAYYYSAGGSPNIAKTIRNGEKDTWFRVQAFARHREAAEAEAGAREAAHKAKIAELENEIDGLRFLASVIKDPDQRLCCDGRECGCMGSTVGQYAAWALSSEAASKAREAALVEALHLAASRFQVASVDAIRAGETRLSADCIAWANDCTRAALTPKEPDA